jgi:hypothetical protein
MDFRAEVGLVWVCREFFGWSEEFTAQVLDDPGRIKIALKDRARYSGWTLTFPVFRSTQWGTDYYWEMSWKDGSTVARWYPQFKQICRRHNDTIGCLVGVAKALQVIERDRRTFLQKEMACDRNRR